MATTVTLLLLGFALGLDSLRVSMGLGALRPSLSRRCALALAFGCCDGLAPLVGLALGSTMSTWLHGVAGVAGPAVLAAYGLYLLGTSQVGDNASDESLWHLCGLPVVLSLDNLVAGAGLGLLRYPPILSAMLLGTMSGLLAFLGLQLGGTITGRLPFRPASLGGALLVATAVLAAFDLL